MMNSRTQSSSLLSSLSCFASGTSVIKTNTPNTVNASSHTNPVSGTSSTTTPPQTAGATTTSSSKLTTNAIASIANSISTSASNGTVAAVSGLAPVPINLKISLSMELLPKEKLYPTPSMQDQLLFADEFDLRLIGCELIQTSGRLLRLPQVSLLASRLKCKVYLFILSRGFFFLFLN